MVYKKLHFTQIVSTHLVLPRLTATTKGENQSDIFRSAQNLKYNLDDAHVHQLKNDYIHQSDTDTEKSTDQ